MSLSKKPIALRHWLAIAFAAAMTVFALVCFFDFSGTPAAHARTNLLTTLLPLNIVFFVFNAHLDKKARQKAVEAEVPVG